MMKKLQSENAYDGIQAAEDPRADAERQRFTRTLLNNLMGMAYRCENDASWTMSFVSAGCEALTGYPMEIFTGGKSAWADLVHPEDRDDARKAVDAALAAGERFELQYRIVDALGRQKWVREQGCGITDGHGKVAAIEGYIADITPLKESQTALARSEAYYKAIVSSAVDSIITSDAHGCIETANRAAETLLGFASDDLIGHNLRTFLPESYDEHCDRSRHRNGRSGETNSPDQGHEVTIMRKNGSPVTIHMSVIEIDINNCRHLVTVMRDLSAQKAAAEELRQEHERLSVTIENAPMGIVTYDIEGPFLSANRAFCEMMGYTVEELIAMSMMDLTHPDDRVESGMLTEKIQAGDLDTYSERKRYVRKDGSILNVNVVNAVTHDATGQPNLVIGQVEDLTPQIRAQSEIHRHHELLAHADRLNTLGEMATGIAHEINQPLTAISLFAQAGRRLFEIGDYDKMQGVFDKLSQHAQRAGAIIERMQDMARRKESVRTTVELNDIIAGVVELAEVDAGALDISIEVQPGGGLPKVSADVVQIQQVLLNLLRNGMEAMRSVECRNGKTIRVKTRQRKDGYLEVKIVDSGYGVSEEVAERLFAPFASTKRAGLGMGLPISKAIIAAHGGQLSFRNNKSSGATFSFTLPAVLQGEQDG